MDVCLSFTKYHKEEWQAAWTISTMLNAIISFFPVKENHDSIGSIDYPIEVRKKFAQSSKKWKCDQCGVIVNLLPEKKPKENFQEKEVEPLINLSDKEEKDDMSGMSDISSPVNRLADAHSTDGKFIKKEKTTPKLKKLELDKRSHISNIIEGVIFEDMNEDENEEECEKNLQNVTTHCRQMNAKIVSKTKEIINSDENNDYLIHDKSNVNKYSEDASRNKLNIPQNDKLIHNTNTNFKIESDNNNDDSIHLHRYNSDINHSGNFSEYFKRLRQAQFESDNYSNENKSKEILPSTKTGEIHKNQLSSIIIDNERYFNSNSLKFNNQSPIKKEENKSFEDSSPKNILEEMFMQENEFSCVIKSMKFHKSKTNEEIMKELIQNNFIETSNRGYKKEYLKSILSNLNNKNIQQESNKTENDTFDLKKLNELNYSDMDNMVSFLELSKSKDNLDALYKQKNNYLKYLTRSKYKTAKKKRLEYLNISMVVIVALIFAIYYYCRHYL